MFTKLKPARTNAEPPSHVEILCDFDALLSKRVGFKFKQKFYELSPVSVENYMQVTVAYRELMEMVSKRAEFSEELIARDQIYLKYFNLIHPLAPDFDFDDLKELPFPLLNQLMNLILKQIAGDPSLYSSEEKDEKKNP